MSAYKTPLSLLLLLICLSTPAPARARDILAVHEPYPPLEICRQGRSYGPHPDIVREAARRCGHQAQFSCLPWKRALAQVREGWADAVFCMSMSPERMGKYHFSSSPMHWDLVVVLTRAGSNISIDKLEDLARWRVGMIRGYFYGMEVERLKLDKVDWAMDTDMLVRKLEAGRTDVALAAFPANTDLDLEPLRQGLVKVVFRDHRCPCYLGFSLHLGAEGRDLADQFGRAFEEMRRDGTMDKIFQGIRKREATVLPR